MKKKIIAIGIVSMFLLVSLTAVSAFKLEESGTKSNQSFTVALDEYDAEISLNDVVSFEISVSDPNGEPASFRNYEVYTRPFEEDISYQRDGDKILGEFTATREGIYSLIVEITDENNDVEKTIFYYFVNPTGTGEVRYYLRDVNDDHNDDGELLLTPPSKEEYWTCVHLAYNSPNEVPADMPLFSILKNIDIYCWYKFDDPNNPNGEMHGICIIKSLFHEGEEFFNSIPIVGSYTWINTKFDVSWSMVRPSWYLLTLLLIGYDCLHPVWMTRPEQPSYADFTYLYCKTPDIKSNSNLDVTILSATSPADNTNNAEIILEGAGTTNLIVQMPNTELTYSAKLNGVECDFTQVNGELTFTLHLDSEDTEHTLYISPGQSSYSTQQFTSPLFLRPLERLLSFPVFNRILNLR